MPDRLTEQEQQSQFEEDVRRIARALYPKAAGGNAELYEGRERDGVFLTDQFVVVMEATVSRKKDKISVDARKTAELIRSLRKEYPDHVVMGTLVTLHSPTAEQAEVVKKYKSEHLKLESYDCFRQRLFDGQSYINCRNHYAFGSAKGQDGSTRLDQSKIVPLDLIARSTSIEKDGLTLDEFSARFVANDFVTRAILVGDFGAGKSTSLHAVYQEGVAAYRRGIGRLPLLLNLRDHTGQKDAVEALERHARNVGYPNPHSLVAAFWAGEISLLLDGFDELTPFAPFSTNSKRIREIRRESVSLIRDILRRAPQNTSILVSGRLHYFDNEKEMISALGLGNEFTVYDLNEFSQEQINDFFKRNGVTGSIPPWLPSRPLLLGYLIQQRIFGGPEFFNDDTGRGAGWSMLLEEISKREAEVNSNLDASVIRQLVERLATLAGKSAEGLGPISNHAIYTTWTQLSGGDPDPAAQQFLLRLPGLQPAEESGENRKFIDADLAAAARAGDIVRLVEAPHSINLSLWENAACDILDIGADVAVASLTKAGVTERRVRAAFESVSNLKEHGSLGVSFARMAFRGGFSIINPKVIVSEAIVDLWELDAEEADHSGILFRGCLFQDLIVRQGWEPSKGPHFLSCEIITVAGRASKSDLPSQNFALCEFEVFTAELVSAASILRLSLDPALVVLLTIIEKLFFQPGRGRDETAFPRGLDPRLRPLVPELLAILRSSGWAEPIKVGGKVIWLPNRSMSAKARALLAAPANSREPMIERAKALR